MESKVVPDHPSILCILRSNVYDMKEKIVVLEANSSAVQDLWKQIIRKAGKDFHTGGGMKKAKTRFLKD